MSYEIRCMKCQSPVEHVCGTDFRRAVMELLTWVPEGGLSSTWLDGEAREAVIKAAQQRDGEDEDFQIMPFFGSQSWSYLLFHKDAARTFHALLNNVLRNAGLDAHQIGQDAWDYVLQTHSEHRCSQRRRVLAFICRFLRQKTGESGNDTLILRELTEENDIDQLDDYVTAAIELGCDPDRLEMVRLAAIGEHSADVTVRFIHSANLAPEDDITTSNEAAELEEGKKARFRAEIEDICEKYGYTLNDLET